MSASPFAPRVCFEPDTLLEDDRVILHKARKFDLELVSFRPRGSEFSSSSPAPHSRREVIRHRGSAVMLPILKTPDGPAVVMVRNQRPALSGTLLELPAGTLEPCESPLSCATRELTEETGYSAATWRELCRFYPTPGLTDELMHVFLATDLWAPGTQRLESDESMTVEPVPLVEALLLARSNAFTDGKTLIALLLAEQMGLFPRSTAALHSPHADARP